MIYTLYIWTVVAVSPGISVYRDWKPIGEYVTTIEASGRMDGKDKCEEAARQLSLTNPVRYRCVRNK